MQRAEDPSSHAMQPERSGLKPTTAFVVLLIGASSIAGALYLTRPEANPAPSGTQTTTEPNFALTNEEAITRFEELEDLRLDSYRTADPTLVPEFLTADSRIGQRVRDEIRQLARDRVSAVLTYDTQRIDVVQNTDNQIQLKQVAIVDSRFVDQSGRDITKKSQRERQEIIWTLHLDGSGWLIFDAVVVDARRVKNA